MHRRLVCLVLSLLGVAAVVVARVAVAHPHLRHATGTLSVEVRDDDGGRVPARLTFRPVGDTPALYFTTIDIAREEAGAITAFDRAFVRRGDADIRVPAGTYDVWISHGPEWDTTRERVTIEPAAEVEIHARLHHVIDTPGWISADLHVHSAASLDSRVPMRDRVLQSVADGVDLIVSTDHNVIADYAPVIAELGLGDLPRSSGSTATGRWRPASAISRASWSTRSRSPTRSGSTPTAPAGSRRPRRTGTERIDQSSEVSMKAGKSSRRR